MAADVQGKASGTLAESTAARTVAVMGPGSGSAFAGRPVTESADGFSIEGIGTVAASQLAEYDRSGLLIWSDPEVRSRLDTPSTPRVQWPSRLAPKTIVLLAVAVAVVALAAAVFLAQNWSASTLAGTYTIEGTLTAGDSDYKIENAAVEVRDQGGNIVANGTTSANQSASFGAKVTYSVVVPKREFYKITIGSHGGPSYSFADLESMGWKLDQTLSR
jgi:hypothetical protein